MTLVISLMKILIELPSWLGDAVMATPAIENIVNYYNQTEITLVGSSISIGRLLAICTLELGQTEQVPEDGYNLLQIS